MKARWVLFVPVGLAVAATCGAVLMGCPGLNTPLEDAHFVLPCPKGPSGPSKLRGARRSGMPHNDMPENGLTENALRTNAVLLGHLAKHPLRSIPEHLTVFPYARALLRYIASCALDESQSLEVSELDLGALRGPNEPPPLPGELGLCAGVDGDYGDWYNEAPTQDCLEIVSACVLARVNARDKRVVISMRDEPRGVLGLMNRVPMEAKYRDGSEVVSLSPYCAYGSNCDWTPQYVGMCTPGSEVRLETSAAVEVRVCAGLYGCDGFLNGTHRTAPAYAGDSLALQRRGDGTSVHFTCPNKPRGGGYYSVMVKGEVPSGGVQFQPECTHQGMKDKNCLYPASEAEVFSAPEGAFYGDLFDLSWNDLVTSPCTSQIVSGLTGGKALWNQVLNGNCLFFGEQHVCYSDSWSNPLTRFSDRLCTSESVACFANEPVPCGTECCGLVDDAHGSYSACSGGNRRWKNTITVYLHNPCDFGEDESCRWTAPAVVRAMGTFNGIAKAITTTQPGVAPTTTGTGPAAPSTLATATPAAEPTPTSTAAPTATPTLAPTTAPTATSTTAPSPAPTPPPAPAPTPTTAPTPSPPTTPLAGDTEPPGGDNPVP